MFILRLTHALDQHKIPYAIVGGYAVALHGAVRGTVDVDLVLRLSKQDFLGAEKAFHSLGLESKLPVTADQIFDFREDYIQNRNLIAWSFYHPKHPLEVLDVVLTHDLNQMKIRKFQIGNQAIRVASIPDLIKMKMQSARPQDLADVEALKTLEKKRRKK